MTNARTLCHSVLRTVTRTIALCITRILARIFHISYSLASGINENFVWFLLRTSADQIMAKRQWRRERDSKFAESCRQSTARWASNSSKYYLPRRRSNGVSVTFCARDTTLIFSLPVLFSSWVPLEEDTSRGSSTGQPSFWNVSLGAFSCKEISIHDAVRHTHSPLASRIYTYPSCKCPWCALLYCPRADIIAILLVVRYRLRWNTSRRRAERAWREKLYSRFSRSEAIVIYEMPGGNFYHSFAKGWLRCSVGFTRIWQKGHEIKKRREEK